ncbi:hypothetical protein SSYM_0294 [Serratia symbiotica str. Tucson]|uniref:Uncharacterized protein n=1 Tax=Serratia symbiotica str. Tucson TaxID=914128 RepID=E9CQW5_9GAMM|nr:hypothetical protein SSYM_0294 [Serratia symbiotica str. Tucson]
MLVSRKHSKEGSTARFQQRFGRFIGSNK